jgi:hypothetical protein
MILLSKNTYFLERPENLLQSGREAIGSRSENKRQEEFSNKKIKPFLRTVKNARCPVIGASILNHR